MTSQNCIRRAQTLLSAAAQQGRRDRAACSVCLPAHHQPALICWAWFSYLGQDQRHPIWHVHRHGHQANAELHRAGHTDVIGDSVCNSAFRVINPFKLPRWPTSKTFPATCLKPRPKQLGWGCASSRCGWGSWRWWCTAAQWVSKSSDSVSGGTSKMGKGDQSCRTKMRTGKMYIYIYI
jgi:hypothetical protein